MENITAQPMIITVENITEKDLWKKELKELIIKYNEWIDDRTKTAKTNDLVKYDKKGKKIHIKK